MGLDERIGSIGMGKDADIVIWNGDPLSSYGHASKVFIEGELYFDASLPGLGLVQADEELADRIIYSPASRVARERRR